MLASLLLAVAGSVTATSSSAASQSAALLPGTPDPRLMVLRLADLPGAHVAGQRYFSDRDFGGAVSYERTFEDARVGRAQLLELGSIAEVGRSVSAARSLVRSVRSLFGSKRGRAALKRELASALAEDDDLISDFQFGRPRNLGAGDESFDVLISFRILGLRVELHFALLRVDRVVGVVSALGEPGARVPFAGMRTVVRTQVARTRQELAPRSLAPPVLDGSAVEGQTLTASAGTWRGNPTSFAYQWRRCDTAGASCVDIPGATTPSYLLTSSDRGFTVQVAVTGQNAFGSATALSAPSGVVASATGAPVSTSPPTVVGTAQQGQTLNATTGSWTGAPTSFLFQWQRCDSAGASCVDIAGATGAAYALTATDVGFRIRVVVTATNAAGSGSSASAPTSPVT